MKKYLVVMFTVALAVAASRGPAEAFPKGAEQDCSKCHSLNPDQAKDVLKGLAPDVKILEINSAPVSGLWEVAIETGGRKSIAYIDFSKKKLIVGNVIDLQSRTNYTQESFNRINKVDVSQIPLENSIVLGPKAAKFKVVVFDDPD